MQAPTDAEYRDWNRTATRPLTDWPIGHMTAARRSRDAKLSALMHGHERPRPGTRLIKSPWTGRRYLVRDQFGC